MKLLYAQVTDKGEADWRYTGYCIVLEAETPVKGAVLLIEKLRKEGAPACAGALGYNVYEVGKENGPQWFWLDRQAAEEGRFKGVLETGVGTYYRGGWNE